MTKRPHYSRGISILIFAVGVACFSCSLAYDTPPNLLDQVRTITGPETNLREPFGVAERNGEIYFSDGETGEIRRLRNGGSMEVFAGNLNTPSQIAFDSAGDLIVADSGSHTIKRVSGNGSVALIAGIENESGFRDGDPNSALFNAPIGVAVADNRIYVADTYNDRIRIIENGIVSTLAGGSRGFADGQGSSAKFDTPLSIAAWKDRLLVADAGNRRIRVVEPDGRVWTVAGNGGDDLIDGPLSESSFVRPTAIAISPGGVVYIADGNAIRVISRRTFPVVETISSARRGFRDGPARAAQFNRPSGLAVGESGRLLVADSDNRLVRAFDSAAQPLEIEAVTPENYSAEEFRQLQPPRWPFEPPEAKRDIAGTLGEIRGELVDTDSQARFHNGLDIAGGYGEKTYFIRNEKALDPMSAENFGTLRELVRLPSLGYIHVRLGRNVNNRPFGDSRFQFDDGMTGVRVRRGTRFSAGDAVGTLNPMNHVHLIAGPSGGEMNALAALILPGISDRIPPVIEDISIFDENWLPIETISSPLRIKLTDKIRVVVRAFDRMDGNSERRRLGVYRLGYQLMTKDLSPVTEIFWNISFDRNPDPRAVKFAYAVGSKSGPTDETVFNYTITNKVSGDAFSEGFLDIGGSGPGQYVLRAHAADHFGNTTYNDTSIEVTQ